MSKKIISLLLVFLMVFFTTVYVSGADVDSLKEKQKKLEGQSAEYERILKDTEKDIEKEEEHNKALVNKINTVNEEIRVSQQRIHELDGDIAQKAIDVRNANKEIEDNMDKLRERVKTIYMAGDVSTLEIILGAKDFSDFLDKMQLIKAVATYDNNIIEETKGILKEVSKQKEELEDSRVELEDVKEKLDARQKEYQDLLKDNQEVLSSLYNKSDDAVSLIDQYDQDIYNVEGEIKDYYDEQERIAARKKQEEEAAAKKEAAKKKENSSSGSGSSSSGSGNSSGSNTGGSTGGSSSGSGSTTPPSSSGYIWPCPGFYYLSSGWSDDRGSYYHGGIDIAGGGIMWTNVVSASSGVVVTAYNSCSHNYSKNYSCGCGGGYGNYVWLDHGNGRATVYAHMSSVTVSQGQSVSAGQLLGYVGTTGYSTGPHLHYETRLYGERYNPMTEY